MKEQDDWKEKFRNKHQKSFAKGGFLTTDLGDDFRIDVESEISFISSLLSSKARALKEKMKEKLELLRPSMIEDVIDESQNNTIDAALSAIESIEI